MQPSETVEIGTMVMLDDDPVGEVFRLRTEADGSHVADMKLRWLTSLQKKKMKEGLVRVSGTRMLWLTSEFIDAHGPPLVDGDQVPVIDRAEREHRKLLSLLRSWMLPGSGIGVLWLLWRISKRWFG